MSNSERLVDCFVEVLKVFTNEIRFIKVKLRCGRVYSRMIFLLIKALRERNKREKDRQSHKVKLD